MLSRKGSPPGVFAGLRIRSLRWGFFLSSFVFSVDGFGFRLNGFNRPVSQPVSGSVDPRARRPVVSMRACLSVSQSGGRWAGPCAEHRQLVSRSAGPPVFKIDDELESPTEGGVLKIYVESLSPNEGACLRYMVNRYRRMRGRV